MEKEKRSQEEGLRRFILSQIEKKGPIPFSQFMEWCLYHPEYGYYQSERTTIGKEGDYYTSPCVHPLFGRLIAKQLFQMAEILGGDTFDVVEMGGGRGFLCEDILNWAEKKLPVFYRRLRYHLIETAPFFLKEQRERLAETEKEGKVFWMDPEAFEEGRFKSRVVSSPTNWSTPFLSTGDFRSWRVKRDLCHPRTGPIGRTMGCTF